MDLGIHAKKSFLGTMENDFRWLLRGYISYLKKGYTCTQFLSHEPKSQKNQT